MTIFTQNEPLTEAEFDRLEKFLESCEGGAVMNIEELDGFFSALVAGPGVVLPSAYLPEVFGGDTPDAHEFESPEEANEIVALMMRHWNTIATTLSKDDIYRPVLLEDENGVAYGNEWARGFIRGTKMCHDGWAGLLGDDDHGGCMIPMLMLYHEHDEDPTLRPKPISPEQREEIIQYMAAGLLGAYRYFRQQERSYASTRAPQPRPANAKIGRNDPCPCGSGKKYKHCCGGATIN